MADYYVDINGNITTKKKKKKENQPSYVVDIDGNISAYKPDPDDIAPVGNEDEGALDFFQKGAFEDGYQRWDVTKSILGTAGDIGVNLLKGAFGPIEGLADYAGYMAANRFEKAGNKEAANLLRKGSQMSVVDYLAKPADEFLDQYSVAGRTTDNIAQGVGQVGTILLTGGAAGAAGLSATAVTSGLLGFSSAGSGMSEAYQGGATDEEATTYGIIAGATEAISNLLFGGLGKSVNALGISHGLSSADDMLAKALTKNIKSTLTKNLLQFGVKAGAEGFEEVIAGGLQALGKKVTYMSEEDLWDIVQDENLLEQFVVGAFTSGIAQAGDLRRANKSGRDFVTGLNADEQTVVDKATEALVAEREKKYGRELTNKEKAEAQKEIRENLERGGLDIDSIAEILGGESYKAFKAESDSFFGSDAYKAVEEADRNERLLPELQKRYDDLHAKMPEKKTGAEQNEEATLFERINAIKNAPKSSDLKAKLDPDAQKRLMDSYQKMHKDTFARVKDSFLAESYAEYERSKQKLDIDVSKYKDENARKTVQAIIDSGLGDNSNSFKHFVDLVAQLSAKHKTLYFDMTSNKRLFGTEHSRAGLTTNGYKLTDENGTTIVINKDAANPLRVVVGHEFAHVLEKSGFYDAMADSVLKFAELKEGKKNLDARIQEATRIYKDDKNTTPEKEVVADLIGEYVFTDYEFISNLAKTNPKGFMKLFTEIKYLARIATAGSKEARELAKVKNNFERAYREFNVGEQKNTANESGVQHSLRRDIVDVNGKEYDMVVELDKEVSKSILSSPKRMMNWIKDNLVGFRLPVLDENGNIEIIEFAGEKEVTYKDRGEGKGVGKNPALGELAYTTGDIRKQVVVNLLEVTNESVADPDNYSTNNDHGWLDENGWKSRKTYVLADDGKIYEAYLRIAKTRDGRNILYGVNLDAEKGIAVDESATQKRAAVIAAMPSAGRVAQTDPKVKSQYSLSPVEAVEPHSGLWHRTHTTDEAKAIFPDMWNVAAEDSEVRNPTQITSTVKSYRKVYDHLKEEGFNGTILDASSGLGYGTKAGIEEYGFDVEDIEPYPDKGYNPKYRDYSALDKKYDVVISNAVLNVLPQDQRDALVVKMGELLNDGGRIFINVRGKDVESLAKTGKNIHLGDMEWIETVKGSYQKGFTKDELVAYLEDALGDGFTVKKTNMFGAVSAVVTKDGGVQYSLSDSDGNKLSNEQAEFFKDSKARDRNGNLLKVYHTTNNDFTVFDKGRKGETTGDYNTYLGFFFADTPEYMSQFPEFENGKTETYYLNMKNPIDMNNISKQAFLDIVEATGGDVQEAAELYDREYADELKRAKFRGDNSPIMEMSRLLEELTGDYFDYAEFYNALKPNYESLMSKGYDGVINSLDGRGWANEYIVLDSNQVKLTSNKNPTADPDVRYSLTEYTEEEKIAHNKAVIDYFGKTYRWAETGYILLDGSRLDLSGKHEGAPGGYRTVDHRDIVDALGSDYGDDTYSGSLVQFMSEGNIRISPESDGINLSIKPNKAQEAALASFIQNAHGEVMLDIDDGNGFTVVSVEYPSGTSAFKVLNDIRGWFDNGTEPQVSNLSQFRYSLSEQTEYAPTFFSQMARVVDDTRQQKLGAASVVNMLRGKGVKAEEIKWSGIEEWLNGKKSVTKEELQEFIKGSQLQIEETVLGDGDGTISYTEDEQHDLQIYIDTQSRRMDWARRLWREAYGEEMPLVIEGADDVSAAISREIIARNGGIRDFAGVDAMSEAEQTLYTEVCQGLHVTDLWIAQIRERAEARQKNTSETHWGQYKLDGGENYREYLFKMPGSDYRNPAMDTHWRGERGVLAHARVQDFDTADGKMLFIEEIQSDWHNEGAKEGYDTKTAESVQAEQQRLFDRVQDDTLSSEERQQAYRELREFEREHQLHRTGKEVPDAPFSKTYHEYVLKRLIREAAEKGYDSVGWTTADIQSDRWSNEYAEGYRIEYDQDIPKFLNKYGKKWGAQVGKTDILTKHLSQDEEVNLYFYADLLEDGEDYIRNKKGVVEVWTMPITEAMKRSVLYEGQPQYSLSDAGKEESAESKFLKYTRGAVRRDTFADRLAEFAPVAETATQAASNTTPIVNQEEERDLFPDDLAPIQGELSVLLAEKDVLDDRLQEAIAAQDMEAFNEISAEYDAVMSRIDELEQRTSNTDMDRLDSITDADAPLEIAREYDSQADIIPLTKKNVTDIAREVKASLGLSSKQMYDVHKLIEEYSNSEFPSREKLFLDIKEKLGTYTEKYKEESVADAKKYLRTTRLYVDDTIRREIADFADLRRRNRGRIRFTNSGTPVDMVYAELSDAYPHLFPESIINPTDQFLQIVDVANMDSTTKTEQEIDDDTLWRVADDIIEYVDDIKRNQREADANRYSREAFDSLMSNADEYAPPEDIAPVAAPVTTNAPAKESVEPTEKIAPTAEEIAEKPIQTVEERLAVKIASFQSELAKNQRLRDQANADYDQEIARLQAEYNARQNKRTIGANDILRRIEKLRRMKRNVDADYSKRISDLEARIEKMNSPEYQTAEHRRSKMAEYTDMWEGLLGDTSTWKDMKLGLSYKTKTLRRILRKVVKDVNGNPDIGLADAIYDELETKYDHHEALLKRESQKMKEVYQKLNLNHAEDTYAHMLGEFRHNPQTTLTADVVNDYYNKNRSKINVAKVEEAITQARKTFDDLLVRVNNVLREQGMKEIPYRQGYFPHFTNPKQNFLQKLFNWKPLDDEIPTSIAGLTEMFDPQRSWQSFNKQRTSDVTDYSLYQGLDTYIHGALDWIYHIEDIQKRRALENHIRYVHSEEGVKARIDAIKAESYDADEAQQMIDSVLAEAKNPLNNLVTDLRARTNTLANKKASMDRGMEETTNRKIYSTMTNLNNRINANMVVGSFSSALTNFIPMVQSWHQVSPLYTVRGLGDYIRSTIRDDGMIEKSDYLTNRLVEEENLYQTGWDKVSDKAAFMMNVVDSITSQTVWRSKYLQNIHEGMSEAEAIKDADQFAKNLMAGRSRGNQPTIFDAKNPLVKILTAFQLEVANQYGYMFEDVPQDTKSKARLVKGYATAFMGAYMYNALYSSLVGRNAAFDPISIFKDLLSDLGLFGDDEEEEPEDIILNLTDNILEEVPFVGGLIGGGRIPVSSAIPYGGDYATLFKDIANGEVSTKELLKPLYYLALPVGGGQLKKLNEGMSMFSDDHPVSGSYTDSGKLRFPVDDTLGNRIKAGMFGQYASENARYYFDNDIAPLSEKQIQEYADVDIPIRDYWDYRDGLKGKDTLGEKLAYIAGLDLPIDKKNLLANNIADRKEPIDLTDWYEYDGLEEFDYAKKYPEKYMFLEANGITVEQYNDFDEDTKEAYSWAYQNPDKFTLSKAVTGDLMEYRRYASDLNDIRADKDENGDSISGSAKEKKLAYINGLNIDYGQKVILYRSLYGGKEDRKTYNNDILDYLNSRNDLSYEDKVTILRELDFTVLDDGTVLWD